MLQQQERAPMRLRTQLQYTPKHPDSTSAKKPSCPKESTPDNQVRSPQGQQDANKEIFAGRTSAVNTTLPISSSMFDAFCSLTGSFGNMIEPLPPSITSTPLSQAGPRHRCTTTADSRHSSASLFTSLNFNLPGYPAIGFGSLTPSVPSIAGSHHISSTWPPNLFPSRPSTPQLTIDQANNIFGLVSECQALGVRLAKDFQVLSGLEVIHRNSVQGTVHETLTLGHSTWEVTYSAILWDNITEAKREAMTHRLHSEADATWKKMHEVMYNHQLEYDR